MPRMIEMAASQDVLPALAVRIYEQQEVASTIGDQESQCLREALLENTLRNMQIVAQGIKLARTLNSVGITPLFLKGTAQLLTVNKEKLGFRKQVDIDLIVEPASLVDACQALQADGYGFYQEQYTSEGQPSLLHDTQAAFRISAAHHHLPPLVKFGQGVFVELHRHFLPRRFQKKNPLEPLFDTASQHESRGATFQVPSTEYQIIHIILGKLVHDGYLASREFPIREAFDYIDLVKNSNGNFDNELLEEHCGNKYRIFCQLVNELMGYKPNISLTMRSNVKHRIQLMQRRYNSPSMEKLLNAYARAAHLSNSMLYSPSKLPAYLRRLPKIGEIIQKNKRSHTLW